jgi:hypothetical protein
MRTEQFMPIRPTWLLNEDEFAKLQREAAKLRETKESKTASWVERERASARLKEVESRLLLALAAKRQAQEQAQQQRSTTGTPKVIRSDDGGALLVTETAREEEPTFMPHTPYYFETTKVQQRPVATNAASLQWPARVSERHALVEAAIRELRRAGAV